MNCEKCNKEHDGKFGSGRFCSRQCANSRNLSDETRRKMGIRANIRSVLSIVCLTCKKTFETKDRKRVFCCGSCAAINTAVITREQKRVWARNSAIKRYAKGDLSIGWSTRSKSFMSYPEKYFAQTFKSWKPEYNFSVGKYFIDFAFVDKMIGVEIDGRRHDDKDIVVKDGVRTKFLESKGWTILRIKWINPINELSKSRLKYQIDNVIKMLV